MNIEVFEPKQDKDTTVRLRLIKGYRGVDLFAVDENGTSLLKGRLLKIKSDGSLILYGDINKDLGLRLTETGYLLT